MNGYLLLDIGSPAGRLFLPASLAVQGFFLTPDEGKVPVRSDGLTKVLVGGEARDQFRRLAGKVIVARPATSCRPGVAK